MSLIIATCFGHPSTVPLKKFGLPLVLAALSAAHIAAADVNVPKNSNLIFQPGNGWIFHHPDDSRQTLFVAPFKNGGWSWGDMFTFKNDGTFTANAINTPGTLTAKSISTGNTSVNWLKVGHDLVLSGSNQWIFHTPDDGRKTLYVAPAIPGGWGWGDQYTFENNGTFTSKAIKTEFIANSYAKGQFAQIGISSPISVYSPGNGEPTVELYGESTKDVSMRFHSGGRTWYSAGLRSTDDIFRISHQGDLNSNVIIEMDMGKISAKTNVFEAQNIWSQSLRAGYVGTARLQVRSDWWADKVFDPDYDLLPLTELADFISENRRLPGVPSEADIRRDGINGAEMFATQMGKIEELTLHVIKLNQDLTEQHKTLASKDAMIEILQRQITELRESQDRLVKRLDRLAGTP